MGLKDFFRPKWKQKNVISRNNHLMQSSTATGAGVLKSHGRTSDPP